MPRAGGRSTPPAQTRTSVTAIPTTLSPTALLGHYWRCLGDLPCRPVILRMHVRRFRCVNDTCPHRTFGEPLPRIAHCRARHTDRLRSSHHAIALALGGNPEARLAIRTGLPVGGTNLLRRIRE